MSCSEKEFLRKWKNEKHYWYKNEWVCNLWKALLSQETRSIAACSSATKSRNSRHDPSVLTWQIICHAGFEVGSRCGQPCGHAVYMSTGNWQKTSLPNYLRGSSATSVTVTLTLLFPTTRGVCLVWTFLQFLFWFTKKSAKHYLKIYI